LLLHIARPPSKRKEVLVVAKEKGERDEPVLNAGTAARGADNPSLDELAKGLASGTISRSRALKLLGGALLGSVIASIPGVAWAANGGNSACAKFCRDNFPPGRERGQCISAAAHGQGPCFEECSFAGEPCPGGTCVPQSPSTGDLVCCPLQRACQDRCCGPGQVCVVDFLGNPTCIEA
jgi:hypothetical protein